MQQHNSGHVLYLNLWSANNNIGYSFNDNPVVKTVYDPSPVSFKLPAGYAFSGFTYGGTGNNVSDGIYGYWNSSLKGWEFFPRPWGPIFFHALGRRNSDGKMNAVESGYWWTAGPYYDKVTNLFFSSTFVHPLNTNSQFGGYGVRPVQE